MNATNLKQISGGTVIKQGDRASTFVYELQDWTGRKMTELNAQTAVIQICAGNKVYWSTTDEVVDGTITFKLFEPLFKGRYYVEVLVNDYVFPSDKRCVLYVESGGTHYQIAELVQYVTMDRLTAELSRLQLDSVSVDLSEYYTKDEINQQVQTITEQLTQQNQRLMSISNDVYDAIETTVSSELQKRRQPPLANVFRYDLSKEPWVLWLSNGCGIRSHSYGTNTTVYGVGSAGGGRLGEVINRFALGVITLDNLKEQVPNPTYWSDDTEVLNPLNSAGRYDWTNVVYHETTHWTKRNQKNVIRVLYEVGLLNEQQILALGAIQKAGTFVS